MMKLKTKKNKLALLALLFIPAVSIAQVESPTRGFISTSQGTTWEEGLVSGNGTVGTNVLGNPIHEKIIFTHERMFLPKFDPIIPLDQSQNLFEIRRLIDEGKYYEATNLQLKLSGQDGFIYPDPFVPVCDMNITMAQNGEVKNYIRSLDFESGEALIQWSDDKGTYERRVFVSRADGVAVIKIKSLTKGGLNCEIKFNRRTLSPELSYNYLEKSYVTSSENIKDVAITSGGDFLSYSHAFTNAYPGSIQSIEGVAYIQSQGGTRSSSRLSQTIESGDEVVIIVDINPVFGTEKTYIDETKAKLKTINYSYPELLARHKEIHNGLFGRVKLDLGGGSDRDLTTEELFAKSTQENINSALLEKEFDAGRYNIISSTGELPPVLQGLWAGTFVPDWASDYTHNGNVPAAIASTLMGNTPELMLAYTSYIESIVPYMEINAKNMFGCRGVVLPSRSTTNGYNNAFAPKFAGGFWIAGAAWAAHYFYDYYLYTGDREFLKNNAVPYMEKVAIFFEDFLYLGEDGKYVFSPTQSPENTPSNTNSQGTFNATMDVAAAKELFRNLIAASKELGINKDRIPVWTDMLSKMPEYMVDENGMFKEWLTPKLANNDMHRHGSQFYELYDNCPAEILSNPELAASIKKSADYRFEKHWRGKGSGFMSFGIFQLGLVGTALHDKDMVYESLQHMVNRFWLNNLVSMHNHKSLFNVDISGGMPAVVIKMLVYSDPGEITLLPALPDAWPTGSIEGVLCRGQVEVEKLQWSPSGVEATLLSAKNQKVVVKCGGKSKTVTLKANQSQTVKF